MSVGATHFARVHASPLAGAPVAPLATTWVTCVARVNYLIMLNTLNISAGSVPRILQTVIILSIYLSYLFLQQGLPSFSLSPLAFASRGRERGLHAPLANMGDEADPEIDFSLKKKKVRCTCREHVHHPSPVLRSPQQ